MAKDTAPIMLVTGVFPNRKVQWQQVILVSHGINLWTDEVVVMPSQPLSYYVAAGAVFDKDIGEYILW